MRDFFRSAIVLFVVLIASAAMTTQARAEGATVITDELCFIDDADWSGTGLPGDFLQTDQSHVVQTPSGNTILTCMFDIPVGFEPSKAVKKTGFECIVPIFDENGDFIGTTTTTETQSVSTPGGKVILTCFLKANK
jgi:hypothetical protein